MPASSVSRWPVIIACCLTLLAVVRVISEYSTFNSTSDEPAHISAGMEWLQLHTYSYELQHPPLARIAVALGPYLKGLRSATRQDTVNGTTAVIFDDGNQILYSDGQYWKNLTLARLGAIPFLILTCAVTFLWGKRYFSPDVGAWATAFVATCSPILGQAGIATLDIACVGTVLLALYRFVIWMEDPARRANAVWLGVTVGIALITKFSSIPYLMACIVGALILKGFSRNASSSTSWRTIVQSAAIVGAAAFLVMWSGYRFTLVPLSATYGVHPSIDTLLANHSILKKLWDILLATPLPLTEWMLGIRDLWRHDVLGHDSYLWGEFRRTGWWWFFPVVVALKTPLGLLGLSMAGAWVLRRGNTLPQRFTALFPLLILFVAMTSRIDAGVRHILPLYPFLAILAGYAMVRAFSSGRTITILACIAALATVAEAIQAYPDDLAHFNLLAGSHPEKYLAESDLDLGQDLHRLSLRLKELKVDHVSIGYFGSAPLDKANLPAYRRLGTDDPLPGYIAVSLRFLNLEYAKNGGYGWLKPYRPVERIGKSIDLYYLDKLP